MMFLWYFHTPPSSRNWAVSSILFHIPTTMLNSQQHFQWPFNLSTGNNTQFSQTVSLRGVPSYIQNEQQTLFINPAEIPPAWSSTSNVHKIAIQVYPPILMSLSKNQKAFSMLLLWKHFYQ